MSPRAPRWRRAYVAVPRELLEQARNLLEPVQRLLLVELVGECSWERGEARLRSGLVVSIDVGEVLWSSRGFAARHGVSRDQARRFMERLEALGWAAGRPAAAPSPAPSPAPQAAPSPTVVRFQKWRGILWPDAEAAPSPAPLPAPPTAPIQPQNQIPLYPEERERASRAPPPPTTEAGKAVERLFAEEHAEVRLRIYGRVRPQDREADRVAAEQLAAAFPLEELRERARAALSHRAWPRIDNLADLARFIDRFSPSPEWAAAERERRAEEERRERAQAALDAYEREHGGGTP